MEHNSVTLSQSEWRVMEALWTGPKTQMELVREMGTGLMEGKIAPKPQGYGTTLPCTWCEYKTACGGAMSGMT